MATSLSQRVVTDDDAIQVLLKKYLRCAEYLIFRCQKLSHIKGANKLEKKCHAELKFLTSLQKKRGFDASHLRSSNLGHYAGILHASENFPDVTRILQPFSRPNKQDSLFVDVVAGQGQIWVKVIARKAQALHLIWAGQGQFGERDLLLQAQDYTESSKMHPVNFHNPKVFFSFYNGVTYGMASALESAGVHALGQRVEVSEDVELKLTDINDSSDVEIIEESVPDLNEDLADKLSIWDDDLDDDSEEEQLESASAVLKRLKLAKDKRVCNLTQKESLSRCRQLVCSVCNKTFSYKGNTSSGCCGNVQTSDATDHTFSCDTDLFVTSSGDCKTKQNVKEIFRKKHIQSQFGTNVLVSEHSSDRNGNNVVSFECDKSSAYLEPSDSTLSDTYHSVSFDVFGDMDSFIRNELLTELPPQYLEEESLSDSASSTKCLGDIDKVNLDITALITLASNVTHGRCHFVFKEKVLTQQATEERSEPCLPDMERFMKGKKLYTCQTAVKSFKTILDTLGGDKEKLRAEKLLQNVTVVPDYMTERTNSLPETSRIKHRSKIIFGTGDHLKAVTLTANSAFVRAAEHQGVNFAVYLHPARALTEGKEKSATVVPQ